MTSQSNLATPPDGGALVGRDLAEYGVARFRDQLFDPVLGLWRRRKSEGWTQKQVAEAIDRDPGWVSRNLRAPGNWTARIAGEMIQGLRGEAEIRIFALEDPIDNPTNFDAYEGYRPNQPRPANVVVDTTNGVTSTLHTTSTEIIGNMINEAIIKNPLIGSVAFGAIR